MTQSQSESTKFAKGGRIIGHFVGIWVHDPGDNAKSFVQGVIFNVEPFIESSDRNFSQLFPDEGKFHSILRVRRSFTIDAANLRTFS